ncbi:response regulator transcription factor [Aquibacillus rhizosphaerae]|uniref:Response regulator transcription factor n=1 Tax=Aquibacillus rhizosphaerae TaxID=3051431 RepID=A0ABT7L2W6_9BACI|nr:response regulator transcription factor [Aquibacillus sp. LR5S19]MDL4838930.1 response regulator transcription factor [Aquibacillus sp. LR5S19]
MKKIVFIKAPSLLRDGIVGVMQQELADFEIKTFGPNEEKAIFNDGKIADLAIIDLDTKIDRQATIDYYKRHNKKVVVWTSSLNNPSLVDLFKQGLHGYFFNGMEKDELIAAVKTILSDKIYINDELSPVLLGDYVKMNEKEPNRPVGVFTNREWEVMELLMEGYSNEKIGNHLFITDKTVKNYISSILKKLEVRDRTNVVLTALRNKWFYV